MQRKFSLAGNDWPRTMAWAAMHEVDRLWSVSVTDVHVMPTLRTMLFRTLDDALKAAFDLSGCDRAWFRREADTEHDEPFIVLRGGKPTCPIVAFLYPAMLGFTMPAVSLARSFDVARTMAEAREAMHAVSDLI